jgi:hypothetical protein
VLDCSDNQKILLPIVEYGNSLMDEFVEGMERRGLGKFIPVLSDCAEESESDIALTITSETLIQMESQFFSAVWVGSRLRGARVWIWNWENIETALVNLWEIQNVEPRIIGPRRMERPPLHTVARSTSIALNGRAMKYPKELISC